MDLIQGTHESGTGLSFSTIDISVFNSTVTNRRVYQGEMFYISYTGESGASSVTSSFAENPVLGIAGTQQNIHGFWCVVLDPCIEVGSLGKARVKGPVKARVVDSTSGTAALTIGTGMPLIAFGALYNGAARLDVKGYSSGTTTRKLMGVVLESATSTAETEASMNAAYTSTAATSSGTTYGKVLVLFDGINGFGGANGE